MTAGKKNLDNNKNDPVPRASDGLIAMDGDEWNDWIQPYLELDFATAKNNARKDSYKAMLQAYSDISAQYNTAAMALAGMYVLLDQFQAQADDIGTQITSAKTNLDLGQDSTSAAMAGLMSDIYSSMQESALALLWQENQVEHNPVLDGHFCTSSHVAAV